MTSVFGYSILFISWIFWLSRVVICFCYTTGINIGMEPFNYNIEIILLFFTLISLVFVSKRKLFGAYTLLTIHTLYFGTELIQMFLNNNNDINMLELSICLIGIILPLIMLLAILFSKERKVEESIDKKTDWFFNNKDYDREHDKRADENQYKF